VEGGHRLEVEVEVEGVVLAVVARGASGDEQKISGVSDRLVSCFAS